MSATRPDDIKLDDSERTRCEVWSRVMGYHRPVSQWNVGKRTEHAMRKHYDEAKTRTKDEAYAQMDRSMQVSEQTE